MSDPSDRDKAPPRKDSERAKLGRADTLDGSMPIPEKLLANKGTYPPEIWERDDGLVTSAKPPQKNKTEKKTGPDTVDSERLTEARARTILNARFSAAGYNLTADATFREGEFLVTLDGYDTDRRVGYAYVSHADADVVTDFDEASEMTIEQLAANGKAWILLIHDSDVPTEDVLERRVDAFFDQLPRDV